MVHAVYSTCFVQTPIPATVEVWSVPAGFTAILHDMVVYFEDDSSGGLPAAAGIAIELDIPGIRVWHIRNAGVRNATYQWHGRQVFHTSMIILGGGLTGSFRACGYLLQDPP